ncbi:MAG: hypothetical protein JSR39_04875 [Verrucomicrobia bacterium]|nr:hypothetical protein [Verrucomicrobiota bacterium]
MTASLSADAVDSTQENVPSMEEHVSVRSRPLDEEKREVMNRQRAIEREQDDAQDDLSSLYRRANLMTNSNQSQFRFAPRIAEKAQFQLAAYPTNCHWLTSISDTGRTIEMEDGSHWEIVTADQYVLNFWRRSDSLVVTPNYNWFSTGDYYITNKSNNTYVRANLYIGPMAFGQYSHWIVAIDHVSGHVTLENGVTWCIASKDAYIFREWEVNDHIILGVYDAWFNSFDHILINVNMDSHVRAKQY